MRVLLISGHGDGDNGASGNGFTEYKLTRDVVNTVAVLMSEKGIDVTKSSPDTDWYKYYRNRDFDYTEYDFVLEVHFNSGGGTGTECFVPDGRVPNEIDKKILNNICNVTGYRNRGFKENNWTNIYEAWKQGVPSQLLEVCFIDSADDMKIYQNMFNEICAAIADAFAVEEEGLTLEQYNELKNEINALKNEITQIKGIRDNAMVYNHIDENMPEWARDAVRWCANNSIIKGTGNGLGLSDIKMWVCVVAYRTAAVTARIFGKNI